jgi:predicted nucleic acid-binding protein
VYFDTSYIAKFYFNEPESSKVRELVRGADVISSSFLAFVEFHAVLHRRIRGGGCTSADARQISRRLSDHMDDGLWNLIPVTEGLLRRTSEIMLTAPPELFIRTADAVHLTAAQEAGEREVWTNDRHMLAAAGFFGLSGRSV